VNYKMTTIQTNLPLARLATPFPSRVNAMKETSL
jgi:hypothetical protein